MDVKLFDLRDNFFVWEGPNAEPNLNCDTLWGHWCGSFNPRNAVDQPEAGDLKPEKDSKRLRMEAFLYGLKCLQADMQCCSKGVTPVIGGTGSHTFAKYI